MQQIKTHNETGTLFLSAEHIKAQYLYKSGPAFILYTVKAILR